MTLKTYISASLEYKDKLVPNTDPRPNQFIRSKILSEIKGYIDSNDETGGKDSYSESYEVIDNQAKQLPKIKQEIEQKLAKEEVMLEDEALKVNTLEYMYRKNRIKAFKNVLGLIQIYIDKGLN